jgi:AcrR family transcriptional regulator
MDDIAGEMCISKKTIYKYFHNKELLIEESTASLHKEVHGIIDNIVNKNTMQFMKILRSVRCLKTCFNHQTTLFISKKTLPRNLWKSDAGELNECSSIFRKKY